MSLFTILKRENELGTLLPVNSAASIPNIPTRKNIFCKPTYQHRLFADVISEIDIANKDSKRVRSVFCLNDEYVWICGESKILRLYNSQGKLVKSIKTKSGNWPMDITVTRNGYLVYSDSIDRTVNLVNDTDDIEPVIALQGWKPQSVSGSSIGGLLIVMDSYDYNHAKVIHFCGYRVIQTIQFDADGFPLYSSGSIKYISENSNLDVCVSDCVAGAVVVVNQTGKFRFRYKGIYSENSCRPFKPFGITTDSQGWILTSDWYNQIIHILDQDGQLLGYIDCGFIDPYGVCVDTRGNLFVTRYYGSKVIKFRYIRNK
eukprot:XP_011413427.1 PREDICTED: uncharacterized protein LOC105318178 [Crassostrea gigas]